MKNKGFTLIELMVVVLIIGILSAVALPQYNRTVRKAKLAELDLIVDAAKKNIDIYTTANNWSITEDVWFTGSEGVGDIEMPGDCNSDSTMCIANVTNYWAGCWSSGECYVETEDGSFFGESYIYLSRHQNSNNWSIDIQGDEKDRKDICRWAQERKYSISEGCEFNDGEMSDAERECREGGGVWHFNKELGTWGCGWK